VEDKIKSENPVDFKELVTQYSDASDKDENQGLLPPKSLEELPKELQKALEHNESPHIIGPIRIASSSFFFQYVGSELEKNQELEKNFETWKAKLVNEKIYARFKDYLQNERGKMEIKFHSIEIES
jgi:parvulin-like peptidyl-prolyl isomerase